MKLRRKKRTMSIPLFSMSDIAFLLLIFIMLVSLINYRKEVNIEHPTAHTAPVTTAENNLEVWIDVTGGIYLDGYTSGMQELELKIEELNNYAPDTRVHVIADRNTPYNIINSVLEVLQTLQYRAVSFAVKTDE